MAENTNNNNQNQQQKPEPAEMFLSEPLNFDSLSESVMISSKEFCRLVSEVFVDVFADFEGCRTDLDTTINQPTITMFFNRFEKPDTMLPYACTKDINTNTKSNMISQLRRIQYRMESGDKYSLTQEGKDILKYYVLHTNRTMNKDGGVKWDSLVNSVSDGANPANNQQLTMVDGFDIQRLSRLLWGAQDPDTGDHWEYILRVIRTMNSPVMMQQGRVASSRDYVFEIKRVNREVTISTAQKMGYGFNTNALDIVKAAFRE